MSEDAGPKPPAPLTKAEAEKVQAWERWRIIFYVMFMALVAAALGVAERFGDSPIGKYMAIGVMAFLFFGAIAVQWSGRCPRCGMLLGKQSRVSLPSHCRACGVAFPKK